MLQNVPWRSPWLSSKYLKKNCNKDPKTKWETIAPKIEALFEAGKKDQSLGYEEQVLIRVRRWRNLIGNDFKVDAMDFNPRGEDDWQGGFEKTAATVKAPGAK